MPLIKEDLFSAEQEINSKKDNTALNSPSSEKGLIKIVGSLLPLAPVLFEQWTGQKIPPMTGTLAEMNITLSALQLSLSQVIQNQQQLWNKLENLEKNASQQFTQLGNQFQSLRLTHTRERKEIEYNPKPEGEY